jgi:hypothetical protein
MLPYNAKIFRSHWHSGDVIVLIDCYVSPIYMTFGIGRFGRFISPETFSMKDEEEREITVILPEELRGQKSPKIILNSKLELFYDF